MTTTGERPIDRKATATTRARYDRLARFYDRMEGRAERWFAPWRAELWRRVRGPRVLEVGIGTGKNVPYYPVGLAVTAIDLSPRMLDQARERAARLEMEVNLQEADAQALPYPNAKFDTVLATFVFCSVPDSMLALGEIRRVLIPGGQILLLEHVLSNWRFLRPLMHRTNPLVVRVMGANINRETVQNVRRAGFQDVCVEDRWLDVVRLIEARAPVGELSA
jgi:phosphatidylethanolamine/phosphatidyl-N-methylethanolamine N-methyltransferase